MKRYQQWASEVDNLVAFSTLTGLRPQSFIHDWRSPATAEARERHRNALLSAAGILAAGPPDLPSPGRFESLIAYEGEPTSDGRIVDDGALTWRDLPIPFMFQTVTGWGHDGAEWAGWYDSIERRGSEVWGSGPFSGQPSGVSAAGIIRELSAGSAPDRGYGVSMDVAPSEEEIEITQVDEDGWPVEGLYHLVKGEILGATGTPFPALARAFVRYVEGSADEGAEPAVPAEEEAALAAAVTLPARTAPRPTRALAAGAAPLRPSQEWFLDPEFDPDHPDMCEQEDGRFACPLTVLDDGRVYFHLARWGTCHIGIEGACVTPPHSETNYAYYRTKACALADGGNHHGQIPTGVVTLGGGHADKRLSAAEAIAHYDESGCAVADVACGEDEWGIWGAGALRPDVTDNQIRALRGSTLSGDWRAIGGNLELVASLAVNVGGFPIVRMASGVPTTLLAAGIVQRSTVQSSDRRIARLEAKYDAMIRELAPTMADAIAKRMGRAAAGCSCQH